MDQTVHLIHLEVTQGIQDESQSVPLIQGRRTFIRAYFNCSSSSPVLGELTIRDPSTQDILSVPSLRSVGSRLDPKVNNQVALQRKELHDGLIFEIPSDWTTRTTVRIEGLKLFSAAPPGLQIACDNCSQQSSDLEFFASPPLKVQLVLLRYVRNASLPPFAPRDPDIDYTVSFLKRAYPSGQVNIETRIVDWSPQPTFDGENPTFNCTVANSILSQIRELDLNNGGDPLDHYYGMVFDGGDKVPDDELFMRGCASVIPGKPDPSAVASGPAGTHPPKPWNRGPTYGDWYAAHELGHTFGRTHVGTSCGDQPEDLNYPYKELLGRLSDSTHTFVALDPGDQNLNIPMAVLPPETFDTMTYCPGEWLSDYTYLGICSDLAGENGNACARIPIARLVGPSASGPPTTGSAGTSNKAGSGATTSTSGPDALGTVRDATPASAPSNGSSLRLTGSVNYTKNTATFTVTPTSQAPPPSGSPSVSATVVQLRDAGEAVVGEYPVTEYRSTDLAPGSDQTGTLAATLPAFPATANVVVLRNGQEIARLGVGSRPAALSVPQATVPTTKDLIESMGGYANAAAKGIGRFDQDQDKGKILYRWGSGAPDPNVSYDVLISLDHSKKWRTVAVNLKEPLLAIDPRWVAGATTATLRVIARNGTKFEEISSDELDLTKR
jgi:hypothetical protein